MSNVCSVRTKRSGEGSVSALSSDVPMPFAWAAIEVQVPATHRLESPQVLLRFVLRVPLLVGETTIISFASWSSHQKAPLSSRA